LGRTVVSNAPEIAIVGTLMKVVSVQPEEASLHFRLQHGRTGRATGVGNVERVVRGDTIIMGEESWEPAPDEAWPEPNSVSVVRRVLDDGSVLLDNGIGIKPIHNDANVQVEANNTVEYNDVDGILRVVSDTPIRSGGLGVDVYDVRGEYQVIDDDNGPTLADFGGYPNVKSRARELIETQLERRANLDKIGARPVKGILFTGAPGTGKTHLARIIAHESRADFYLISGPSIVSKWVGDTEDTLRKIFEAATQSESGRAIIFFDEIDSIAERRDGDSHESSKRLVAQLLTLMDGFDDQGKSVVVIAATNRADVLDPALTRPGRFDWEIEFGLPTLSDRLEILSVRAGYLATSGDLPVEDIAVLSEGWSAAELTAIWTEAALVAAGDDRESISAEDVAQAFERVATKPRRAFHAEVEK
jgi:transitional endoplasmic reticulum ATPase